MRQAQRSDQAGAVVHRALVAFVLRSVAAFCRHRPSPAVDLPESPQLPATDTPVGYWPITLVTPRSDPDPDHPYGLGTD